MNGILLDTCIIIDVLRHRQAALIWLKSRTGNLYLASTTITEVRAGEKGDREKMVFDTLLEQFTILPITTEVAEIAGALLRRHGRSYSVALGDAQIAAAAISQNLPLATLNLKHFPMFPHLAAPY